MLTTFRAKGLLPDDHPLAAGVLGRSGTPVASWLMNESDLVLVVGASFSNHTGIATYKTLVAIDDSPGSVGRFNPVDASILADAGLALAALDAAVGPAAEGDRPAAGCRCAASDLASGEAAPGPATTGAVEWPRPRSSTR